MEQMLIDKVIEDFDWGAGVSGDIGELIEQSAEMTFIDLENLRRG